MADGVTKKTDWTPIVPVPIDCPVPAPKSHPHRGEPLARHLYHDRDGNPLGWVYDYLDSGGQPKRETCVWAENAVGERMWRWQAFPEPRPLYGLMDVAGEKALGDVAIPVLVFPCEADADAAREALVEVLLDQGGTAADLPCISWPGGQFTALRADWSPLGGWSVVIWPEYGRKRKALSATEKAAGVDPDSKPFLKPVHQPGWRTAGKIAEQLTGVGCEVHILNLPEIGAEPADWGVRSVIEQGIAGSALWEFIRVRLSRFSPAASGTDKPPPPDLPADELSTPKPAVAAGGGDDPGWEWMRRIVRKDDKPVDCRENVWLYLRHHPDLSNVVWADEFAHRIMMRHPAPWVDPVGFAPREWDTCDDFELGLWLVEQDRLLIKGEGTLASAVAWAARKQRYHPVKDYLGGLSWDGIPRLDDWLTDFMGVQKTPYTMLAGRMFLIGMVARIYKPGCMMRTMPIFEGFQGRGKSTALRILGGEWFSDTPLDLNSKDSLQNIQGVWLYEWAEMDSLSRADARSVKAYVSSPVDRFRAPYDRKPADHARQTVFAGSTNQFHDYFKDPSGSTRFWPLRVEAVESIKLQELAQVRDQLFAEAMHAYGAGEPWWPSREQQKALFDPEQADRGSHDAWGDIIEVWLRANPVPEIGAADILTKSLKIDPGKIPAGGGMETRVGIIMQQLGWGKARKMDKGIRRYYYTVPADWFYVSTAPQEDTNEPF